MSMIDTISMNSRQHTNPFCNLSYWSSDLPFFRANGSYCITDALNSSWGAEVKNKNNENLLTFTQRKAFELRMWTVLSLTISFNIIYKTYAYTCPANEGTTYTCIICCDPKKKCTQYILILVWIALNQIVWLIVHVGKKHVMDGPLMHQMQHHYW